jgi:hypothetical protein
VLFLQYDWSFTSVRSRPVVARLIEQWDEHDEAPQVLFGRIDLTEPDRPMRNGLNAWLDLQNVRLHGDGTLLWVEHGVVRDFVESAASHNATGLVQRTQQAFDSTK